MANPFEFESRRDVLSGNTYITAKVFDVDFMHVAINKIIADIAEGIARKYIEEHYAEIAAALNPIAIANMSIAEAGAQINETLHKKMPDKIIEVLKTDTQIYQRGFLGGMSRIR